MKRLIFLMLILACFSESVFGTGEPSTYFNIYVPPNNEIMGRDVCVIVTALYDSTTFSIIDDGADGDTDDSKSGMLMQGQSYILFLRGNGVNDDAPHSGESATKQDGDYLKITSSKLVFASQATLSGWQHDWVASFNKTSKGEKFIVYSNGTNGTSPNDINVFAYEDSTMVVVKKVSVTALNAQGCTNVDMTHGTIVLQKMIGVGKDLINFYTNGRDLLRPGETYLIESNKPVTVQYGALYGGNERDGGGYVPSSNGSSAGSLFYFAVPYQAANEQEIRIVSWNADNNITLERFDGTSWVNVKSYTGVGAMKAVDWVGANYNKTYPNVFRVTCSAGKKVSVLEANWMETGSPGTSDMATMASAEGGTSSGRKFLVYMPPPSNQQRMTNPFTGLKLTQHTHAYLYAKDSCTVTVKDAYTNGSKLNRSYHIAAGRYADVNLTLADWKSIYNGTGSAASGPERPYLLIQSSDDISVMIANTNDNWMMYFGSSLEQGITQSTTDSRDYAKPGDTVMVTSTISIPTGSQVTNPGIVLKVSEGATTVDCHFKDIGSSSVINGAISTVPSKGATITIPGVPVLDSSHDYTVETKIVMQPMGSDGRLIANNDLVTVDMTISGVVNGNFQQSSSSTGITNQSLNTSNYAFSMVSNVAPAYDSVNTWNSCWVDLNQDNYPDLFVPAYDKTEKNRVYINKHDGTFMRSDYNSLTAGKDLSVVTAVFADMDNDGKTEAFLGGNIGQSCELHHKDASGKYHKSNAGDYSQDKGYAQTLSIADYDHDGFADIFVSEYFPSNFCRLYHNNGSGSYTKVTTGDIAQVSTYAGGSTWADYDNDGWPDLFIPVSGTSGTTLSKKNILFHNDGNGSFHKVTDGDLVNDEGNSTASAWGDYDNDGNPDLFVSNASNEKNCLYHNNGNGTFTKITAGDIVNEKGDWHGCQWLDYDNDGWLDLYVLSNDSTETKRLYRNNGDGTFTNKSNEIVCAAFKNSISCSWADYDKNGFPDLYVTTTGKLPDYLFKNNGNSNKWISILLKGSSSNSSAIGAKVYAKANISGQARWQMREISAASGLGSQNSLNACFGLGTATLVDSLIIKWPSGIIQYHTNLNANQFLQIQEQAAGIVKGKVYLDANSNCTADSTESGIRNVRLKITPGNIYLNTNDQGAFTSLLPPGNYTISMEPSDYWNSTCTSSYSVSVTSIGTVNANLLFAATPKVSGIDAYIEGGISACRKGYKSQVAITYGNKGTLNFHGGQVSLTMPPGMYALHAVPAWSQASGNTYTWNLSDLNTGSCGRILLTDSIGFSYNKGDSFTIQTAILNSDADLQPSDNMVALKSTIVGAVDPNEMVVTPEGEGPEGYITNKELMRYTIDFENIGNYEAEKVTIDYIIPDELDAATFELTSSSHSCHYILDGKKLSILFDQIHLPALADGSTDNQGFVSFALKQNAHLTPGTKIWGDASIIFDYEEPLGTNKVMNTIFAEQGNEKHNSLFIYPNPLDDGTATVRTAAGQTNAMLESIALFSVAGSNFFHQSGIHALNYSLSRKVFPAPGIYIIRAVDSEGRMYEGKVNVR